MNPCAHCTHSAYRNESTMTCNYSVSPVVVLCSDSCPNWIREIGADDEN